jgi:hypothetical protein
MSIGPIYRRVCLGDSPKGSGAQVRVFVEIAIDKPQEAVVWDLQILKVNEVRGGLGFGQVNTDLRNKVELSAGSGQIPFKGNDQSIREVLGEELASGNE